MQEFIKKFFNKIIRIKPVISVIKIDGIIGSVGAGRNGISLHSIEDKLEEAFNIINLKAVILIINSPGGSPVQSELIYNKLIYLKKKKNIKIYGFIEDIAASGGYWIVLASDKIISAKNSIIGSLGVISSGFGFVKLIEKIGLERRVYSEGDSKAILDPFMPEKKEDIAIIKAIQKDIYQNFKDHVLKCREGKIKNNNEIFSGRIWSSKQALEIGLVDNISDINTIIEKEFGDKIKIKKINMDKSWLKSKLGLTFDNFIDKIFSKLEIYLLKNF